MKGGHRMANQEHLNILKQGVEIWNQWRMIHRNVSLDLSEADLEGIDLSEPYPTFSLTEERYPTSLGADLRGINFRRANLSRANLSGADLSGADLSGADLSGVQLSTVRPNFNFHHARWGRDIRYGIQPLEYILTDLSGTCLKGANLRGVKLSEIDLSRADLSETYLERLEFSHAILREANLTGAHLSKANLTGAHLQEANLARADLWDANLREANLTSAHLQEAYLREANITKAKLTNADFTKARLWGTHIDDVDLRLVRGLEFVEHFGPSHIGIDTIYRSKGEISEIFLRGTGVPDSFLEYMHSLVGKPIDYYTCFISSSSADQGFAERLYSDLQSKGVRCWFAPEDLKIGAKIRSNIDESIRTYDKLLLILSQHSVASQWVEQEVETALEKERREGRIVLFPIRLDNIVMEVEGGWPALIRNTRHIGNFTLWKQHDNYQKAFERLLRDLKAEVEKEHGDHQTQ
jgi:uncharacterized protein YjbI with pentapeptide repeats